MTLLARAAEAATPDLAAVKAKNRLAWSSGNYALLGTTLQIVGETLCEAVDLRSNQHVLDVAAGNGNASIAAARRFAEVMSTDYVQSLLDHGRDRAKANHLSISFREADAENLPFADSAFDVVLSTFGVMFAPDQRRAAKELLRVCRPGGKIGLASWTPRSFIGRLFNVIGKHLPPAPGVKSPALWGDEAHLLSLFGSAVSLSTELKTFNFRYGSAKHWLEMFRSYYGPVLKAFAALDLAVGAALEADIYALLDEFNVAGDGTLVVPSAYLQVVATKVS